ncbi:hypothetical protein SAMN06295912_108104 [Sphingomonas laterariae]|uniref:Uncharacterized protein n=1 Tax=Edaphosphingomonas laterariae TaxID=861865 RepID=A0A239F8R7_9SPHN|nr:hypothetical protein [Sphingomonas laterariae]SNS52878.1 hypothetical protein SAMN06295912_108104 [Sphingomonas laterariae]
MLLSPFAIGLAAWRPVPAAAPEPAQPDHIIKEDGGDLLTESGDLFLTE